MQSPQITSHGWARVEVGDHGSFKDAKLFPGGARAWDWKETGTRHVPGVQPADVQELIDAGAEQVVLAQGVYGRLHVQESTLELLEDEGIEVHVLQTDEAVEVYNRLAQQGPTGALIHSTC